jgi:hypothetical protein
MGITMMHFFPNCKSHLLSIENPTTFELFLMQHCQANFIFFLHLDKLSATVEFSFEINLKWFKYRIVLKYFFIALISKIVAIL